MNWLALILAFVVVSVVTALFVFVPEFLEELLIGALSLAAFALAVWAVYLMIGGLGWV